MSNSDSKKIAELRSEYSALKRSAIVFAIIICAWVALAPFFLTYSQLRTKRLDILNSGGGTTISHSVDDGENGRIRVFNKNNTMILDIGSTKLYDGAIELFNTKSVPVVTLSSLSDGSGSILIADRRKNPIVFLYAPQDGDGTAKTFERSTQDVVK